MILAAAGKLTLPRVRMGLRSYKAGARAEADRSRGAIGRKRCCCAAARNILSPVNPITKSRPTEICEGSTSTSSETPNRRIPPQHSNSDIPNSFAGVRRQRTAIQTFLANTIAKTEVPMAPTSSSSSNSPLCACGTLQPKFVEISTAAGFVDSQNALKPQPRSGRCEIQILTNSHKSVRPVRVASFPRKPRIRSGDSAKTTNAGIATLTSIIRATKFRRVRARNTSTAQKKKIDIKRSRRSRSERQAGKHYDHHGA